MGGRDRTVDSLRGIACILLVTLHVTYDKLDEAQWLDWYGDTFIYIRMPLFAFLSGVVYAWRPLTDHREYGTFVSKKVRRLLIPYVIFVPLIGASQILLGANTAPDLEPWNWILYSLPPYWFLLATFWVYAAVALADSYGLLRTKLNVGIVFATVLAVNVIFDMQDAEGILQFTSAVYLGLFFLAGLAATRFGWKNVGRRTAWAVTGVTAALFAYTQLAVLDVWAVNANQRQDIFGIALGIAFPLAFIALGFSNRFLAWIGGYSYGIFLLHPFAIAATSAVLGFLGTPLVLDLVVLSVAGILGSIAGVIVLRKVSVGRVMLGERAKRKKEPVAA